MIWSVGFIDLIDFINFAEADGLFELADMAGLTDLFELGDVVAFGLRPNCLICLNWAIWPIQLILRTNSDPNAFLADSD